VIRVTASLVRHPGGSEILRHDSLPFARPELRKEIEGALSWFCDEGGYTIEEGNCSVVLRIEPVKGGDEHVKGRSDGN
jgi:hypothetical protein